MIEQKLENSKNKFVTEGDIKKTETKRNGCERKITTEDSFLSKPVFFVVFFFHEVNIHLNLKFRTGIINNAIILLLEKEYSQSKSYKLN